MSKKKLEWSLEKIDFPENELIAYACFTPGPNPYFTRPLYDEEVELELDNGKKESK